MSLAWRILLLALLLNALTVGSVQVEYQRRRVGQGERTADQLPFAPAREAAGEPAQACVRPGCRKRTLIRAGER